MLPDAQLGDANSCNKADEMSADAMGDRVAGAAEVHFADVPAMGYKVLSRSATRRTEDGTESISR